MRIKYLLLLLLLGTLTAEAHDFAVTSDGQTLCFDILSAAEKTVQVTYTGPRNAHHPSAATGDLVIPSTVAHGGVTYSVVAIGAKAFSGADRLTGVVLPAGITAIGDFAFEGCTALSKVVFPGGPVTFGQGVFFGCTRLSDLSLGSDWTSVDLAMFRWSDSLTYLAIPAKIQKIQNLKKLKALRSVDVDANNARFSSVQGVLYNRDGTVLYGVPRAYEGALVVADGTKTVTIGALIDCPGITSIDLPASVETFPFRETSRLSALTQVTMRGQTPIVNAYRGGQGYFTLQTAVSGVTLLVPSSAKKAWQAALATEAGDYTLTAQPEAVPYALGEGEMPTAKQVKGSKNL